jgi:hypothetical protein
VKRKRPPPPLGQGGVGEPEPIGASGRSPYPYSNPKNLRHHERASGASRAPSVAGRGSDPPASSAVGVLRSSGPCRAPGRSG